MGPRISGVTGSLLFGGGMMLGGLGVHVHSLPLMYLGYGIVAGCGCGLAYLPPIATLVYVQLSLSHIYTHIGFCKFE